MWKWLLGAGAVIITGAIVLGRKVAMGPAENEKADVNGLVSGEPFRLAEQRGVSLDVYALGRMMASEAGTKAARIAVGWAAVNHAVARKESISTVLLRASKNHRQAEGKFGAQNLGKYASTRAVPSDAVLVDAKAILAGKMKDPTKGSRQWDAPAAQNRMVGKVAGYTKTAEEVAAARLKTNDMVMVDGVPNIRFWRPKGVVAPT
jgi:hypothetical protein